MKIFPFDKSKQSEYSEFVAAHQSGSFLQSWSWGEFQESLGNKVLRFGAEDNGRLIATAQFIMNKTPKLSGEYLYCPYGPLSANDDGGVIKAMLSEIKKQFPEIKFVRLEPKQEFNLTGIKTKRIQPGKTLVTDLTQSEDELLKAMHPKTRYNIKVAAKHNVEVSVNEKNTEEAIKLLEQTARRQKYKTHGANYYRRLIEFFQHNDGDAKLNLYVARYENKITACAVTIDNANTCTYLFGGSDDKYKNIMAPYAMHWQAIRDAKKNNSSSYDWWGIETSSGETPGFVEFKKRWGGTEITYPACIDIVYKSTWYNIYKVLRALNRMF